jgi:dephospho-CoA kinase
VDLTLALRIGVTGGIGSGKSTIAKMWVACGAYLIDLDAISRQLTAPGGCALPTLRSAFGNSVFDTKNHLDRTALRERVFGNAQAKAQLENIMHPLITEQCDAQAAQAPAGKPLVFEIPLLVESKKWRDRLDKVVVVDCSETTQIERVMQRSNWSRETVLAVMAQQASRAQRRAVADTVIVNEGATLAQLEAQVQGLWQAWCSVEQST